MIRVAVCDDFLHIRKYFASIITAQEDMQLVGTTASGAEMEKLAAEEKPDVILMDIQMESEYAGVEATRHIMEKNPEIKIVMLTIHADADYISQAYSAGAVDYIIKTDSKEDICRAIRDVYEGKTQVRPQVAKELISVFRNMYREKQSLIYVISMVSKLTASELEILRYLCEGKTRREIAKERGVEQDTIKFHVKNILKKMKYTSTAEIVKELNDLGVVDIYFK